MKLLVRNLARATTEAELRPLFEAYGRVQSCTLVFDKTTGESKGFGFVEMPKPGEAKSAMKNLNGMNLAGNTIRVKKAEKHPAETASPKTAADASDS
ncbi:MAG: RNA-binding protein [Gammaproteobacteria bacterium]|nr:RNA-binding protein [Gammaproteobacteria bacterium]